jgi:ATP synthase protein I
MVEEPRKERPEEGRALADLIGAKAQRKLLAERRPAQVWFGLGMMGLIGWSVVIPTLVGAVLGNWLDRDHPAAFSWTLALLLAGLMVGCMNAWYWISKEDRAMREQRGERHD